MNLNFAIVNDFWKDFFSQDVSTDCTDEAGKVKQNDNPFIEPVQTQTVVDMKDVMVLNDIIEQAAGRQSHASDHGGNFLFL